MSHEALKSREHEVTWELDGITMAGTLTEPTEPDSFPAVVMVAGSGPTDRNWNSPLLPGDNGSGRLIANVLAENDIASLRYDKRGSGPHVADNVQKLMGRVSMQSHVDELRDAVTVLAQEDGVQKSHIFGLGNSEGTLHVLNYAISNTETPLAGLVLIAPPGLDVGTVTRNQLVEQAAALPNGDALLALYDQAMQRFLAGEPAKPDAALPEGVQDIFKGLESPYNLPFSRELWTTNAADLLEKVGIPVLVVIGKKDTQVSWTADGEVLQNAAKDKHNVTFLFPENANHVLKHETKTREEIRGSYTPAGYNAAEAQLDTEAMQTIVTWMKDQI